MSPETTDGENSHGVPSPYPDGFTSLGTTVADHGDELRDLPNVVGIGVGFKMTGGVETHRRCITVFVGRKVPASHLAVDEQVPPRFHLHLTDVIERT